MSKFERYAEAKTYQNEALDQKTVAQTRETEDEIKNKLNLSYEKLDLQRKLADMMATITNFKHAVEEPTLVVKIEERKAIAEKLQ